MKEKNPFSIATEHEVLYKIKKCEGLREENWRAPLKRHKIGESHLCIQQEDRKTKL